MNKYLVVDDKLVRLFYWSPEELLLPQPDGTAVLYQEHLDGPTLDEEEAKELFPEEFI